MSESEIVFRSDVTVELVKASASDADVIWAARVSTAGEQSMAEIGEDTAVSHRFPRTKNRPNTNPD